MGLQKDLDNVNAWCAKWRMSLNASKCYFLQYNPRSERRQFHPQYSIGSTPIERKPQVKDLGVIMSEDFKFTAHVDLVCRRAMGELNRIRRSFVSRSPKFLSEIFKQYVRPHLEYAVEVWNPRAVGNIKKIEKVQNRMTKLLPTGRVLSSEQRNISLGLTTHEVRRLRGDLINVYKNINNESLFKLRNSDRFRGHSKTISIPAVNTTLRQHSFSYRPLVAWNSLPESVVNAPDLNHFKHKIDEYICFNQMRSIF